MSLAVHNSHFLQSSSQWITPLTIKSSPSFGPSRTTAFATSSGQVFYNTSKFTLKSLLGNPSQLEANFNYYLDGKEVNPETYAICKSDMMIKGNNPENIRYGSTLATDEFSGTCFDFMLSNPPYGKSWKTDQGQIFEKNGANTVIIDPRFEVKLPDASGEIQTVSAEPIIAKELYLEIDTEEQCLAARTWYPVVEDGSATIYEPDSELRDTENIPLTYAGGIEAYFHKEVLPHVPDAWIDDSKTVIVDEISFNKYFYVHQPLRDLAEVVKEIRDLEAETEGLLEQILSFSN